MEKSKKQSGLTAADKEWIANLMVTTIRPIQEDVSLLKKDVSEIKDRLEAIEKCPTIQKELK